MAVREADQAGVTEGRRDARMLRWLRRQVNQDLRYWRHNYADCHLTQDRREQLVADCKAKLVLLSWADSWARVRGPGYGYPGRPEVQAAMLANLQLVMAGVRRIAQGYRNRDGWRPEWELPFREEDR